MFLKIFQAMMPKEVTFQAQFVEQSNNIGRVAARLRDVVQGTASLEDAFVDIIRIEGEADGITRNILQSLHKAFIKPFDSCDIHALATKMDDTIDYVEDIVQRAKIYNVTSYTPQMVSQAYILVDCAAMVRRAVELLPAIAKNVNELTALGVAVSDREGQADSILRDGLAELFANASSSNSIEVMKNKEMYELLEAAIDCCDDIMNTIEGIVIGQV